MYAPSTGRYEFAYQITCSKRPFINDVPYLFHQIYDVGDFALLCSVDNRRGERWAGGDFLSADRVVIWSDVGKAYLYKLPVQ